MGDGRGSGTAPGSPAWGAAVTVLLGGLVYAAFRGVQAGAGALLEALLAPDAASDVPEGLHFALVTCTTTLTCGALVWCAARLRRDTVPGRYLALHGVARGVLVRWLVATACFVVLADLAMVALDRPVVTDYWLELRDSAGVPVLFWFALVLAAPLFEELLFRGLLFPGLAASRLGGPGAVVVTAAAFTAIHVQYGPVELGVIFVLGLLFGAARLATGSLAVPLAMHVLNNLVSAVELEIAFALGG